MLGFQRYVVTLRVMLVMLVAELNVMMSPPLHRRGTFHLLIRKQKKKQKASRCFDALWINPF